MKKHLLFVLLFVFTLANAQVKVGLKAGFTISTLIEEGGGDGSSKTGFYGGGYVRIPVIKKFSFQPEVIFSTQGTKQRTSTYIPDNMGGIIAVNREADFKFNYINIPLMAQYEIITGLRAELGPQIGFNVSKKVDIDYSSPVVSYSTKQDFPLTAMDLGLAMGGNYELKNGLNVSARYCIGLTNISDTSAYNLKNSVFSFGVGYTF